MGEELSKLQKFLRQSKKEVVAPDGLTEAETYYFEGVKQGIDIAIGEIKRVLEISKARAKLEELEAQGGRVSVTLPAFAAQNVDVVIEPVEPIDGTEEAANQGSY